jgi:hypothetical protein
MTMLTRILTAVLLTSSAATLQARAQEAAPAPALTVELNALQPTDKGCRFTFVVTNALGGTLGSAAFELVLFDKAGMVDRLTIVDFKDLPDGKTKVRQFDFSGVDCATVGRVLINDATQCVGDGIDPKACIAGIKTETRTDIQFGT